MDMMCFLETAVRASFAANGRLVLGMLVFVEIGPPAAAWRGADRNADECGGGRTGARMAAGA
jgi:hypothetical protein